MYSALIPLLQDSGSATTNTDIQDPDVKVSDSDDVDSIFGDIEEASLPDEEDFPVDEKMLIEEQKMLEEKQRLFEQRGYDEKMCKGLGRATGVQDLPRLEGFLQKRSPYRLKSWQFRYFRLANRKLTWFKTNKDLIPLGTIDFDLVSATIEEQGSEKVTVKSARDCLCWCCSPNYTQDVIFVIKPEGCDRMFKLRARHDIARDWIAKLLLHSSNSPAFTDDGLYVAKQEKFWKFDRISCSRFEKIADTGDIILFRTASAAAKLQRSITRGFYDHVALVMRFADGRLALLESTANLGVSLLLWSDFIYNDWHKLYPKMVLRRMYFNRTDERMAGFEEWTQDTVGKPYKLSATKLVRSKSDGIEDDFFCSELVANALKALGVVRKDKAGSLYWPSSFSTKAKHSIDEDLIDGAEIGEELLIDFNLLAK
eukprot:Platyproteum_vivax@DN4646_c0_g1_i1.p1